MSFPLKRAISWSLRHLGIVSLARSLQRTADVTVLMFHKVDSKMFEAQVRYLKRHYHPIAEKDLFDYLRRGKKLPANSVLLTFDDGYLNNYRYAWPVLKKYDVPAVIFLVTDLIGKQQMPWYDLVEYVVSHSRKKSVVFQGRSYPLDDKGRRELLKTCYFSAVTAPDADRQRMVAELVEASGVDLPRRLPDEYAFMTWEQAREMMPLVSFGAHTHTHPVLPNLSSAQKLFELRTSHDEVRKHLGVSPLSLCYPNGDYDEETLSLMRKAGYSLGFSSNFGRNPSSVNPFLVQRIGVNVQDTASVLAVKLSPLSNLFKGFKTRKHFKVVMITNYYLPQTGGITTVVHELVERLHKRRVNVSVLPYPQFFRKVEGAFGNGKALHRFLVLLFIAYATLYLFVLGLRRRKIVVHSHSANFCARVGRIARTIGLRSVHTFHTDLAMMGDSVEAKAPYLDKIDQLTAVSDFLGSSCTAHYGLSRPVLTIYNGAPAVKYVKGHARHAAVRLLYVGHLFEVKDPLLFVKTVEELSKRVAVEAVMIGDGFLKDELKLYIEQHKLGMVRMLGSQSSSTVQRYYEWADVFVLTSKGEGLGVVLLEAMAHGVPVVSTVAGGSVEVVEHLKNGVLVQQRTPQAVADGVQLALEHRSVLVKSALRTVHGRFDWEHITDQYLNLYRRLTFEKNYQSSEENVS